jgi:hypothetical protein
LKVTGHRHRHRHFAAGVRAFTTTLTAAGFAAVFIGLINGCTSAWPPPAANQNQIASPGAANTNAYMLHTPNAATPATAAPKPPRLSVGTSYPDTQLILPWFLNDIINFVNYR